MRFQQEGVLMDLDSMDKFKIKFSAAALDGGTKEFYVVTPKTLVAKYIYQDFRLMSETKGKFFDKYPGDAGAKMLDESQIEIVEDG